MNLKDALTRNLIFVGGKGGVGKTSVSLAIARALAAQKKNTLWVGFEDPTKKPFQIERPSPFLTLLNNSAHEAFEEYIGMKLGAPKIAQMFLSNSLLKSLIRASPGVHELVLLGKVWFERKNYDHVVVDLPSTGYGLTMFQATKNFSEMLRGSPVSSDADGMLETFGDPKLTSQIIVALAEEMPLRESLELKDHLKALFSKIEPVLLANRVFPKPATPIELLPKTAATRYILEKVELETMNLKIWNEAQCTFETIPYLPPDVIGGITEKIQKCL